MAGRDGGCLYVPLCVGGSAAILGMVSEMYQTTGGLGLIVSAVAALAGLSGALLIKIGLRRREGNAAARALLAVERERVIGKIDVVLAPGIGETERLAIIDSFIPRLARPPAARDRVVIVAELSGELAMLLSRARRAARHVNKSRVKQLRLLDDVANNDKYRDLLALTDDAEAMRKLTSQVATLEEALASTVRDAVEAARALGSAAS
ncbi:hypothetical protein OIE66_13770 [Nonomuraea sp. NBC_01738]|uniref:hypothetical protein n=1 Tax=Nonomuraea sp. NBC_01738 TaxID=2976003 RepID=UPI002E145D37|nr:hypothetical protein OIE66_13770 [Nonomuraea sp. NBC_01738]